MYGVFFRRIAQGTSTAINTSIFVTVRIKSTEAHVHAFLVDRFNIMYSSIQSFFLSAQHSLVLILKVEIDAAERMGGPNH